MLQASQAQALFFSCFPPPSLPQIENLRFGYNPYTWSFDAVKWLGGDPVDRRHWWHHVREEQTGLGGEDAREEILLISVKL